MSSYDSRVATTITIRVFEAKDKQQPCCVAHGFTSDGRTFIESNVYPGRDPEAQARAIAEVTTWLRGNRPNWTIRVIDQIAPIEECAIGAMSLE